MTPPITLKFAPLRSSARAALQWRLLLLWMLGLLLPTALATLPVFQLLSAHLDYSVHAPRLARALDLLTIADLQLVAARQWAYLSGAAWLAALLTLLISPLLSGMAISAARAGPVEGHVANFRDLIAGGLREYPRMLRMLLLAILLLGAAGLLVGAVLDPARAALPTELLVLAGLSGFLLLTLTHASIDAGRAMMALDRRRTSSIGSWWLGCRLLRRHLFSALGVYLGITLAGLALAALLAWIRLQVPSIGLPALVGAFLLTQAIVAVIAWMRIARLFALIELARKLARGPAA